MLPRVLIPSALLLLASGPAAAAQSEPATRFHRDPALLAEKEAKIVALFGQKSPQAGAELEKLFREDIIAKVRPAYGKLVFDIEDVVDLVSAYWMVAWLAANGIVDDSRPDRETAQAVRAQMRMVMLANPGFAALDDRGRQDIGDTMLLQALLAEIQMQAAATQGAAMKRQVSDAVQAQAAALLKVDMRRMSLTAKGFAGQGAPSAAGTAPPPPARTPVRASGMSATSKAAGLYFRAISGGGGVDWEPLAFFGNGEYWEIGATPLDELNVAESKAREPHRWGRWQQAGGGFRLTGSDGHSNDYTLPSGNFFPAFSSAQGGATLSGAYSRTSSSGLQGGGTTVTLFVDKIRFTPDGQFVEGSNMGAMGSGVYAGRKTGGSGRYRLSGTTLELTYADGRVKRTSFAYGATGRPAHPSKDMVFIGGDTFVTD